MSDNVKKVCYLGLPVICFINIFFANSTAETCAWVCAFAGWSAHLIELKSK